MTEKNEKRLSQLTSNFSIRLKKRDQENNTHNNIVDESVKEIIPYKIHYNKFMLAVILYILSLGILFLLAKTFPKLYIKLNCRECDVSEADLFIIVDQDNNFTIIPAFYENFLTTNPLLNYIFNLNYKNKETQRAMQDSPYKGEDYLQKSEKSLVLYYRHNKYIFNHAKHYFEAVKFDYANYSNSEIHNLLGLGISKPFEYNYLLNKFGKNIIAMEEKSFTRILLEQIIHPFYLYQLYSCYCWIKNDYVSFLVIVVILAVSILIINSYQILVNYKNLLHFNFDFSTKVIRKLNDENDEFDLSDKKELLNTNSQFIVPGDVIEMTDGETIPCDCILLEGLCSVNESELTGESSIVMKCYLPYDEEKFEYQRNNLSILYSGTKIEKCESTQYEGKVRAVVINTGFNTQRGDLIQNILFPKPTNFNFKKDILIYIFFSLIIYVICIFVMIEIYINIQGSYKDLQSLVYNCMDFLTVVLPPALPICYTFSAYYFHYCLNQKYIKCINDVKMNAAGRVNVIVLDKTGTLTEQGLGMYGYQATKVIESLPENINDRKFHIEFDEVEHMAKTYNILHQEFWKKFSENRNLEDFLKRKEKSFKNENNNGEGKNKLFENYVNKSSNNTDVKIKNSSNNKEHKYSKLFFNIFRRSTVKNLTNFITNDNYQTDPKLNVIFFVECLATCHSIYKINDTYFGNNIDKMIFDNLAWTQIIRNESVPGQSIKSESPTKISNTLYEMIPNKSYKIYEETYFKNIHDNSADLEFITYKLLIVKRFEFSSKFQSMSVIVHNYFDNSNRFFIKGSPERLIYMCKPESIPEDFNLKLLEHTKNGLRVLACATKLLPNKHPMYYNNQNDRSIFECELTFLGFIIFQNNLKPDTKHVISKLNESHCKLIMATGDNPFTSISVAKQCEFINKNCNIIQIDTHNEKLKFSYLFKNEEPVYNEKIRNTIKTSNKDISEIMSGKTERKLILNEPDDNLFFGSNLLKCIDNTLDFDNMRNFFELFTKSSNLNECVICISGPAFRNIIDYLKSQRNLRKLKHTKTYSKENELNYSDIKKLINLIENHGKIFYRMSPSDKVELINFLKENKSNIVAMCGDGANDCGALLASDAGVAINHKVGTSVTSHFFCKLDSISSLEIIIKNGRACFENTKIIFEYMLLCAIIQSCAVVINRSNRNDMSNMQYLFVDFGVVLIKSILISKTGANMKIMKDKPNQTILNSKFVLSILGQIIIQIITSVVFFMILTTYQPNNESDITHEDDDYPPSIYNSYLFILNVFQYSSTIFALSHFAKHKKGIFSNKVYVAYAFGIVFIMLSLTSVNYFEKITTYAELIYLVNIVLLTLGFSLSKKRF